VLYVRRDANRFRVYNANRFRVYKAQHLALSSVANVPLILHQTYLRFPPPHVIERLKQFAPEFEYRFYDDAAARKFLQEHFSPAVVQCFDTLKQGAHKADLLRYCLLYIHGGVYIDIKSQLIQPLRDMIYANTVTTSLSWVSGVYQGFIAAPPRQEIFLHLIQDIVHNPNPAVFHHYCFEFLRYIRDDIGSPSWKGVPEGFHVGSRHNYMLFTEIFTSSAGDCEDGLDQYGICAYLYSKGLRVLKVRDANFPYLPTFESNG